MTARRTVLLWGLLLLAPFITRPLFVDDHAHFTEARLLSEGKALYRGSTSALGWQPGQAPGEANPPLYFLLMSAVIRLAGTRLWVAHAVILLATLFGALGFFALAQRYVKYPAWATILWLASPHVWLTANSLLLDALVAPPMLVGLALWMRGWERRAPVLLAAGALCLGLAPLVKYTGFLGIVLALLWTCLDARGKRTWRWAWLALPVLMSLAWIMYSAHVYGQSHLTAVAWDRMAQPSLSQALMVIVYLVATTPMLWLGFPIARPLFGALFGLIGLATGTYLIGFSASGLQIGIWLAVFGVWVIALASMATSFFRATRFLWIWAALGIAMFTVAIPWVCARYLGIVSPPLILLTVMALERRGAWLLTSPKARIAVAASFILFGGALAWADMREARIDRQAAQAIAAWRQAHAPERPAYYPAAVLGGFGYYLAEQGWQPLAPGAPAPAGSVVALVRRTLPSLFWPALPHGRVAQIESYTMRLPLRTLDGASGAGFYGSIWGPLPFAWSRSPVETYAIFLGDPVNSGRGSVSGSAG